MAARPVPGPPPSRPSPLRLAAQRGATMPAGVTMPVAAGTPPPDPQCSMDYWSHRCPAGCGTWVPNHRLACARHAHRTVTA